MLPNRSAIAQKVHAEVILDMLKVVGRFEDLVLDPSSPQDLASEVFRTNGVAAFSTHTPEATVARWRSEGVALCERFRALAESAPGGLGLGKEAGFRELVHKDIGRFDVSLDDCADAAGAGFIGEIREHAEKTIAPLLTHLFGPSYRLNGQGMVVSYPGAAAQRFHIDSSWLFAGLPQQPCHFVTVFVTLLPAVAPTEFVLGSHQHTHTLGRETVAEQYPDNEYCHALMARPEVTPAVLSTAAAGGDVIVMDGRTLHRGLGNEEAVRPVAYFSFSPPWYREWPTSQMKDGRTLFC